MKSITLSIISLLFVTLTFAQDKTVYLTNKQYREFVQYVIDSTVVDFLCKTNMTQYGKKMKMNKDYLIKKGILKNKDNALNWDKLQNNSRIFETFRDKFNKHADERLQLQTVELNTKLFICNYQNASKLLSVPVFPNSLYWSSFSDSINKTTSNQYFGGSIFDALSKTYFSNTRFDNSPVVGLSIEQVNAYTNWHNNRSKSAISAHFSNKPYTLQLKNVTIDHWLIDQNNYSEFLQWVSDSLIIQKLGNVDNRFLLQETENGVPLDPALLNWTNHASLIKHTSKDIIAINAMTGYFKPDSDLINVHKLIYTFSQLKSTFYVPDSLINEKYVKIIPNQFPNRNVLEYQVNIYPHNATNNSTDSILWKKWQKFNPSIQNINYIMAYAYWNWLMTKNQKLYKVKNPISIYLYPNLTQWQKIKTTNKLPSIPEQIILSPESIVIVSNK